MKKEKFYKFNTSSIKPSCRDCSKNCKVLYDKHRDEHFSQTCGLVLLQNNKYYIRDHKIKYMKKRRKRKIKQSQNWVA